MNRAHRVFDIFLQSKTGIVHPTLIEEVNRTIRPQAPGHGGDCVYDQAKLFFALAERRLSLLSFGDVLRNAKRSSWPALFIADYIALAVDVAQLTVGAHHTKFHLEVLARPYCLVALLIYTRAVIRVNKLE